MAGSLSETLSGMKEEELVTNQKQELPLSPGEGASSVVASSPPVAAERKQRRIAGNPNPDAEIVALSPKTLLATNRFMCDICPKGFKREQNLQLHRRGHNLPSKLKKNTGHEIRKKV
ncbi:protein indeterminate-domain 12-like [Apium graveolens]|uniref:protein indeterminate-domain 12-like n=1 Tax=Apium graveolens TaxID=4045 RepID=UPI003D7BFB30